MTDIVNPNKPGKDMSLDKALSIIEAADDELRASRAEHRMNLLERSVTEDEIANSSINKIGVLASVTTLTGFISAVAGLGGIELFVVPAVLGTAALLGTSHAPRKIHKILSGKKWKTYTEESELNTAYNQLTEEEFSKQEKEILSKTKKALKVANKALAQQGQEIVYSSGEGFSIKSSQPVQASQWDKLRLETIRNQGLEAVGITPKTKELTA